MKPSVEAMYEAMRAELRRIEKVMELMKVVWGWQDMAVLQMVARKMAGQ